MKSILSELAIVCFSLMVVHLLLTGTSSAEIIPEKIAGVWLFDEGNGQKARELTRNSSDGLLKSDPEWVDGKFGKAIKFDGKNDYVEIELPDVFSNIPNNDFTMSFWLNVQDISGSGTVWTRIIEARHDNSNYVQFDIQINNGELGINVISAGVEKTLIVDSPIKADTWYHVMGVWDADQISVSLYLDGIPQSGIGATPASPGNQKTLNLGRRSDGDVMTYFAGIIDEFAILNMALTEEDIGSLMEEGLKIIAAVSPSDKLPLTWGELKAR